MEPATAAPQAAPTGSDEFETRLRKAGEQCLAAHVPADLDDLVKQLDFGAEFSRSRSDPASQRRLADLHSFVLRWQSYLNLRVEEKPVEMIENALRTLAQMVDPAVMPRSRILAIHPPERPLPPPPAQPPVIPAINRVIANLATPADLEEAIGKIRVLSNASTTNKNVATVYLQVLNARLAAYREIQAGKILSDFFSHLANMGYETWFDEFSPAAALSLTRLRKALLLQADTVFLGATTDAPQASDSLESYTNRIATTAARNNDWPLVWRALEFYGLARNSQEWLIQNLDGIDYFITAGEQQTTGQYAAAVTSYLRALRSTGPYLPLTTIGRNLTRLAAEQPEAYAAGLRRALSPELNGSVNQLSRWAGQIDAPPSPGPNLPPLRGGRGGYMPPPSEELDFLQHIVLPMPRPVRGRGPQPGPVSLPRRSAGPVSDGAS